MLNQLSPFFYSVTLVGESYTFFVISLRFEYFPNIKMGLTDCFENMNVPPCIWFDGGNRRNSYAAMLSGFLVSLFKMKYKQKNYLTLFVVFCWLVGYNRCLKCAEWNSSRVSRVWSCRNYISNYGKLCFKCTGK